MDPKPPTLLPVPRDEKRLFLTPEMWEDLEETAQFHTDAYVTADEKRVLSRNELIEGFLDWALSLFWKDKGGRPKNAADRKKKVEAFAAVIRAELEAQRKAAADARARGEDPNNSQNR